MVVPNYISVRPLRLNPAGPVVQGVGQIGEGKEGQPRCFPWSHLDHWPEEGGHGGRAGKMKDEKGNSEETIQIQDVGGPSEAFHAIM